MLVHGAFNFLAIFSKRWSGVCVNRDIVTDPWECRIVYQSNKLYCGVW